MAEAGPSRRRFLIGLGVGAVGATSLGALAFAAGTGPGGPLGGQWRFGEFTAGCTEADFDDGRLATVTVPHCVTPLSWQGWDPTRWQQRWVYRQHFDAPAELRAGRAFVRLDGVLSTATVYLNGRRIGRGVGGYLPLTCEMTGRLSETANVLAVVVDGRWRLDVPPDRPDFAQPTAIDYYQPAGIYRPVTALTTPDTYLSDVYARPVDVLTGQRSLALRCEIDSRRAVQRPVRLTATLAQGGPVLAGASVDLSGLPAGPTAVPMTMTGLSVVRLWDLDDPALCDVLVTLTIGGRAVHRYPVRVGFRDATFTDDGFFLNGRRLMLFGVNRHQWYPYVGGAMPERVQRRDALILKRELNCNMVRCSHYPQSTAFLDACDELGLLVWEEIPGWDYVGDLAWRNRVVADVRSMVVRDRNHPSVIVWGTRINETLGQVRLYDRTDRLARRLDPSRPTSGAVAGPSGYQEPLYPSLGAGSSVFAYNDYSRPPVPNEPPPLLPPRPGVPYLVTEAIGTLVGPIHFRRTDPVRAQADQATLHAWVHERAAADDRYCGLLAWCGFDYASGGLHSVDGVKYPGVVDFFRNPKLGAGFYQSQVDPKRQVMIEPDFYWDFGPHSPVTRPGPEATIWSNCDQLVVHLDGRRAAAVRSERFSHLANPPFVADLTVRRGHRPDLRIDGYVDGRLALRRSFSADPALDRLSLKADDDRLVADGVDTTRIAVRTVDRYGAPRPFVTGLVTFAVAGPGVLVGDNPLDLGATGGAAAVWLTTMNGLTGDVLLSASHPTLGTAEVAVRTTSPAR